MLIGTSVGAPLRPGGGAATSPQPPMRCSLWKALSEGRGEYDYGRVLGVRPLHLTWSLRVIHTLYRCGADMSIADDDQRTPLHWACGDNGRSFDVPNVSTRSRRRRTLQDVFPRIQALVACGANVNARDRDLTTPLLTACVHLRLKTQVFSVVKYLVEVGGADVNVADRLGTPLIAVASRDTETVGLSSGSTWTKKYRLQREQRRNGQSKHDDNEGRQKERQCLVASLPSSVSGDARDAGSRTDGDDIVDPRCSTFGGISTPLDMGTHDETVGELLLRHGADPTAVDSSGKTALIHACVFRNLRLARALIAHGGTSLINYVDNQRYTALHYLAMRNAEDVVPLVQLLVLSGADGTGKGPGPGQLTPLEVALRYFNTPVVNFLSVAMRHT